MRIIGLVARKGGVGKTTLAIHLAQLAATQGETCILIDMDMQASSSAWRCKRKAQGVEGVPVIQADAESLPGLLVKLEERGATMVLIDTRPDVGDVARVVCEVSDHVVIPTGATVLDIEAIKDTALIAHRA
ncbi:MAG: ParA family protein, partial [Chloroflexi bacterium]|nr:ParA family protein [Chloroflexota bacterium]